MLHRLGERLEANRLPRRKERRAESRIVGERRSGCRVLVIVKAIALVGDFDLARTEQGGEDQPQHITFPTVGFAAESFFQRLSHAPVFVAFALYNVEELSVKVHVLQLYASYFHAAHAATVQEANENIMFEQLRMCKHSPNLLTAKDYREFGWLWNGGEVEGVVTAIPQQGEAGGRGVVRNFKALEDRKVKQSLQALAKEGGVNIITRHVVRPSEEEIRDNPPSRSAKLRAVEIVG